MPNEDKLVQAIEQGIITKEQAEKLAALEVSSSQSEADIIYDKPLNNDSEGFRFITGFADIFLALGMIIFYSGLFGTGLVISIYGWLILAAISWGLSEVVATWQRRSLPSMVAATVFVFLLSLACYSVIQGLSLRYLLGLIGNGGIIAAPNIWIWPACIMGTSLLYYLRFKLPFALFLGALGFTNMVFLLVVGPSGIGERSHLIIPSLFLSGLALFATAIWFDSRDRKRLTRLSDNAFWLHLVASPLIVHSVMWQSASWLVGEQSIKDTALGEVGLPLALIVLAVFFTLMVVAVIIDRRAMLVSSLIYVTLALSYLIALGDTSSSVSLVPILIGAGILAIGIGWQYLRSFLFRILPLSRIEPYLPAVAR